MKKRKFELKEKVMLVDRKTNKELEDGIIVEYEYFNDIGETVPKSESTTELFDDEFYYIVLQHNENDEMLFVECCEDELRKIK